ncbi:MAG: hypothetical protein MUP13_09615 [Thermoanaerobaculales bacterium]|nr:hypothetical protein [Thermoanaerobaculales bacterium]
MTRELRVASCGLRRLLIAFALVFLGFGWVVAPSAVAQTQIVPVANLLTAPARYDGATITVEGELIGDYGFRRSGFMWTQLNDDSYARGPIVEGGTLTGANSGIGIRMPEAAAEGLSPPGGYRIRGPIVRATGQWKFHDPDRQGETYLEVSSIEIVESGVQLSEGPNMPVLLAGIVLLLLGIAAMLRYVHLGNRA